MLFLFTGLARVLVHGLEEVIDELRTAALAGTAGGRRGERRAPSSGDGGTARGACPCGAYGAR